MLNKILLLGNPKLHEISELLLPTEINEIKIITTQLHEVLMEFRTQFDAGRAIAAPQIGYSKRIIYMNIDKPVIMLNPQLFDFSNEMFEVWDDCLCFPNLLVKVNRHKYCKLKFYDEFWHENILTLSNDLAELLQHECDHLDGILATQRAINNTSFKMKNIWS